MNDLLQRLTASPGSPTLPARHSRPRLLYAVNHCYPFSSNGYAVRTHGVASALVRAGVEVIAASRPGTPWDRAGFAADNFALEHRIDGVRYVHLPQPSQVGLALPDYLNRAVAAFADLLRVFKPDVVMAASNWHNALPAAVAAREAGVPFFYEVRGFWEISQASRDPAWAGSPGFLHAVAGETAVAQAAQRVFTINRHMRAELVRRGVAAEKVDLVPNGFAGWPSPETSGVASRASLGIRARFVVGYIGSFNVYEGLEDLIEAVARLRARGVDVALLLVGSSTQSAGMALGECAMSAAYRALAVDLLLDEHLMLPGRVTPEQTAAYYALLDVVVIPRRPFEVCEIVSPMKPVEAAAHGKRVLMSDVAPLADLVGLCPNFSVFAKGDGAALADRLGELLAGGDFELPRCEALAGLTWERNVGAMVEEVARCKGAKVGGDGTAH